MTDAATEPSAALPTSLQAQAVIAVWRAGHFDYFDFSNLLGLLEATLAQTLGAARDLYRGGWAANPKSHPKIQSEKGLNYERDRYQSGGCLSAPCWGHGYALAGRAAYALGVRP